MDILQVCQNVAPTAEAIGLKDGGTMILMRESSVEEYRRVQSEIEKAGFAFDSDRQEGDALFSTYEKNGQVLLRGAAQR